MAIEYLVTHSGGFHADELLSTAILKFIFPKAKIIRSREKDWTTPNNRKIIYDVGGEYDLNNQIFDHHQRPNPLRVDGQPYSSFGLIWKHFGKEFLKINSVSNEDIEHIYREFDTKFVLPIDLIDNGEIDLSLSGAIADRKSTRLNSSHGLISYAVFCLKKKKKSIQPSLLSNKESPHMLLHLQV